MDRMEGRDSLVRTERRFSRKTFTFTARTWKVASTRTRTSMQRLCNIKYTARRSIFFFLPFFFPSLPNVHSSMPMGLLPWRDSICRFRIVFFTRHVQARMVESIPGVRAVFYIYGYRGGAAELGG